MICIGQLLFIHGYLNLEAGRKYMENIQCHYSGAYSLAKLVLL
jgi:hypothetical protein